MEVFFVAEYMMKFRSVSPHCPTSLAPVHIFHVFQPCWNSLICLKRPFPSNFETISHVVTEHFSLLFIVLIRVFQKNKTNRVCVWREKERDIYYKELAHVTLKAWEVPRASVAKINTQESQHVGLIPIWKAENQDSQWWKVHSEGQWAWNPRRANVSVQVQRQEKTGVSAQGSQARGAKGVLSYSVFLLYSGL